MKRIVSLFTILVCLAGCSTKLAVNPIEGQPTARLETGQKAYIALPADGKYADKVYAGTGMQVSSYVAQALSPYVTSSQMDNQVLPLETLLQNSSAAGAKYLFIPDITHWEPRVAAWSGIPTRVHIELKVFDVATGQILAANSVSVRGKIATFVSQHAHELAETAVEALVTSFY